jgi:hypothetical protein
MPSPVWADACAAIIASGSARHKLRAHLAVFIMEYSEKCIVTLSAYFDAATPTCSLPNENLFRAIATYGRREKSFRFNWVENRRSCASTEGPLRAVNADAPTGSLERRRSNRASDAVFLRNKPFSANPKSSTKSAQISLDRPCARFWFRLRIHLVFLTEESEVATPEVLSELWKNARKSMFSTGHKVRIRLFTDQ